MSQYADLVLSMSDELASLADPDVDQSIERALGRAGELAGADRCYLFLRSEPAGDRVSNTHEWCAPGIEPAKDFLQDLSLTHFPWAFSILDGSQELRVPSVASAPAGPEREEWEREHIQSLFCTPLRIGGVASGFIGCDWVRRSDALSEATLQTIRVAGALVGGALERRRAYRSLEYRSQFEELVLRISSRFIQLRGAQVGPAIDEALDSIARFAGVDAGALGLELRGLLVAHGFAGLIDAEAPASRLGQAATAPVAPASRVWTADEVRLLELAAQVLGNALGRAEADRTEARLQEQLRQTQKMEVVGQLAGGIAHDFNNMLLSITIATDIALRPDVPPNARQLALEEIRHAAERAAALTRQLLTFSRRRVVQLGAVDLNALVEDLLRMIRRVVRESIEIELRRGEGLGTLQADAAQLEQVLLNLCVNASDAMPEGGRLTIETARLAEGPAPLPGEADAGADHWVRLTVRDTGVGMAEAVRERAFEPFFTTKQPGKGSGLGLSTVYAIVQQHRGRVALSSTLGAGTELRIDLPAVAGALDADRPRADRESRGGRETILLAEDDASVRRIVTGLLERAGYRVLAAPDGEDAVRLFEAEPAAIDLVLLDAVMPRKSGLDAYREIVALRPDVRVLFSSGYSTSVFPAGFFDDGRHELLEKPYDGTTLLRRIRARIDGEDP